MKENYYWSKNKTLMERLGKKQLIVELKEKAYQLPETLNKYKLELNEDGSLITYTYNAKDGGTGISKLLGAISEAGLVVKDLQINESSLEDIFVNLVKKL